MVKIDFRQYAIKEAFSTQLIFCNSTTWLTLLKYFFELIQDFTKKWLIFTLSEDLIPQFR
jgi:hypothetical protein